MELRLLRYFLAVAREENITLAARFLNITQPTLSRQIKDLELELGQKLFIRGSHKVVLTKEGLMLKKRAEEILDMVNKAKAEITYVKDSIEGSVYIGCGETKSMRLVAQIIADVRKKHPNIKFHLFSGNAEDVTERLDKGLLDFGLLIQPVDLSRYDFVAMPVKDVWGVLMPRDSPLAKKKNIVKDDLLKVPLICSRQIMQKNKTGNKVADWFSADYDKLNIIASYNLIFNASLLVEKGIGYALTLDGLVDTMDNDRLCFRPLNPTLESELSMVWKKYQVFSSPAEVFVQTMQDKAAIWQKDSDG